MDSRLLLRLRYAPYTAVALKDGPLSFTDLHGKVGATGRSMSNTLRKLMDFGLVIQPFKRGRYELTKLGHEAVPLLQQIIDLDKPGVAACGTQVTTGQTVELDGDEVTW